MKKLLTEFIGTFFLTFIGAGVTGALLVGTVLSALDFASDKDASMEAVDMSNEACDPAAPQPNCTELHAEATSRIEAGRGKALRTNILIAGTAVAGVATGVIALLLTDWSGWSEGDDSGPDTAFTIVPTPDGVNARLGGRF